MSGAPKLSLVFQLFHVGLYKTHMGIEILRPSADEGEWKLTSGLKYWGGKSRPEEDK